MMKQHKEVQNQLKMFIEKQLPKPKRVARNVLLNKFTNSPRHGSLTSLPRVFSREIWQNACSLVCRPNFLNEYCDLNGNKIL